MDRIRTCIGCGTKAEKVELFRIVKDANGRPQFDKSGRMQGRGAYVCSHRCFDRVMKNSRLSSALRCKVDSDAYEEISESLSKASGRASDTGEE